MDGGASGVRAYLLGPDYRVLSGREELYRGRDWVEVSALCIGSLAPGAARVALAMPGLKTPDRRGIARLNHGPPIPDFLDRLAALLPRASLGPLESDGAMAVLGETVAPGQLVGVSSALYLGGGSGLSEGLLVEGRSVALEELVPRAWELGLEESLSPAGWNARFAARAGRDPLGSLEDEALQGGLAAAVLRHGARELSGFLARRVAELGLLGAAPRRIVLGQRFGRLLQEPYRGLFPVESPVPVVGSTFRAAPAVGAVLRLVESDQR